MTSAVFARVCHVAPRARAEGLGRRSPRFHTRANDRRRRPTQLAAMGVKERDPWRIEPDLPPPAPEHHVDGLGEKLSGVLTEFLVRAPAQFLVENVLAPLYARRRDRGAGRYTLSEGTVDESDCDGRGMYLDVETDACVYICREGYVWDVTTRSCKLIVTNPTPRAAAVDAHVPSVGRKPGMGKNVRKIEAPSALPAKLEKRFYGTRDESPLDGAVRWLVNRMVGGGSDTEKCAVGFFYDAKGKKCTPICRPGYVYDPVTKRCVSADTSDRMIL